MRLPINSPALVRGTVLKRGQLITISDRALMRAAAEFPDKLNALLGHMVQYEHDALLEKELTIFPSEKMALYDRHLLFDPRYHDDKVATFETHDGELSDNHNITHGEFVVWKNNLRRGIDTVIHSFVFIDRTYTQVMYMGSISFRLLEAAGRAGIREGKESYFFNREQAYKYNLL